VFPAPLTSQSVCSSTAAVENTTGKAMGGDNLVQFLCKMGIVVKFAIARDHESIVHL
jgi:hypothetical protein